MSDEEHLSIPGPRNVRPIIFTDYIEGYGFLPGAMEREYPWLRCCNWKELSRHFEPDGRMHVVEITGVPIQHIRMGKLTIVIEILNETESLIARR